MGKTAQVVVLGGGLSGLAAAWEIADASGAEVVVVERSSAVGGLAGSFEHDGRFYPLGYHHILPTDRTLLYFLHLIGALPGVRWRRVPMLFRMDGRLYDFSELDDFLRLPLGGAQKLRFAALMARAYLKRNWTDWEGRTARELVDSWGGVQVRHSVFEPLCDLKFELSSDEVSAAWMGTRLHAREGSGRLGYIPDMNWTKVLCEGVADLVRRRGVEVRTGTAVAGFQSRGDNLCRVDFEGGDSIEADIFVSAMPTSVLARLLPGDQGLESIRYTALLSMVGVTRNPIPNDFYWLNLLSPRLTASAIFLLTALNPTIGNGEEHCVNFVSHLRSSDSGLFRLATDDMVSRYLDDYRTVFGQDLELDWTHLSRISAYSPIFTPSYRNLDVTSCIWRNLYFTGNYRTYPSVASTGTALRSGLETGQVVAEHIKGRQRRRRTPPHRRPASPSSGRVLAARRSG